MSAFILSKLPVDFDYLCRSGKTVEEAMKEPRRVILDRESHGEQIAVIEAEPEKTGDTVIKSAWCVARDKVDESKLFRIHGEGWFA